MINAQKQVYSNEFKVGLFVLIGLVFFLSLGFYFSKDAFKDKGKTYYIIFNFLNGLRQGSSVRYAGGLNVGKVVKIEPYHNKAKITLEVDGKFKITNKTTFTILGNGLLGEKFINMNLTDAHMNPGEAVKDIPENSVLIGKEDIGFDKLLTSVTTLSEKLTNVIVPIAQIVGNLSETGSIEKTLSNLNSLIKSANGVLGDNRPDIHKLVKNTEQIIGKVNSGKGSLSKLINDKNLAESLTDIIYNLKLITLKLSNNPILGSNNKKKPRNNFYEN